MLKIQAPRVSVIIIAYNQARFINDAIQSALDQTHPNVEVIVVDDGSSDETVVKAKEYGNQVRIISQRNGGVSSARNTGIKHSSGEYLCFLDGDDLLGKETIQLGLKEFAGNPNLGLFFTNVQLRDESLSNHLGNFRMEKPPKVGQLGYCLMQNRGTTVGMLVRRSALEQVGEFDKSLKTCEDWDLLLRMVEKFRFDTNPEPIGIYRQVQGSISKNHYQMFDDANRVIRAAFRRSKQKLKLVWCLFHGYFNNTRGTFEKIGMDSKILSKKRFLFLFALRRPIFGIFMLVWLLRYLKNRLIGVRAGGKND